MGLAETFALLRKHNNLAEVMRALEERGLEAGDRSPDNVVILSVERARRQGIEGGIRKG